MATQNFKRNLLLILYGEGKKNLTLVVCFLLLLKRKIKKHLTLAAYFLCLETPSLPACYPLRIKPVSAVPPALQMDSLPLSHQGSLDSVLKSRHMTLLTKVCIVKVGFSSCHVMRG